MIEFKEIKVGTDEYEQMVDLRHRILRVPIGLTLTKEELVDDKDHILLGVFLSENKRLIGCCVLTESDEKVVQLRQMSVEEAYQRKGLGAQLVKYAEQVAQEHNYTWMELHARQTAIDFYKKLGYSIESDIFTEVGIPHVEMNKRINNK